MLFVLKYGDKKQEIRLNNFGVGVRIEDANVPQGEEEVYVDLWFDFKAINRINYDRDLLSVSLSISGYGMYTIQFQEWDVKTAKALADALRSRI